MIPDFPPRRQSRSSSQESRQSDESTSDVLSSPCRDKVLALKQNTANSKQQNSKTAKEQKSKTAKQVITIVIIHLDPMLRGSRRLEPVRHL